MPEGQGVCGCAEQCLSTCGDHPMSCSSMQRAPQARSTPQASLRLGPCNFNYAAQIKMARRLAAVLPMTQVWARSTTQARMHEGRRAVPGGTPIGVGSRHVQACMHARTAQPLANQHHQRCCACPVTPRQQTASKKYKRWTSLETPSPSTRPGAGEQAQPWLASGHMRTRQIVLSPLPARRCCKALHRPLRVSAALQVRDCRAVGVHPALPSDLPLPFMVRRGWLS